MDLKKDLDEYLLLQSDQKKSFKLTIPNIQKPQWFNRAPHQEEDETWFQQTKKGCCEGCCPTLVIYYQSAYIKLYILFVSCRVGCRKLLDLVSAFAWEFYVFHSHWCIYQYYYSKLGNFRCYSHLEASLWSWGKYQSTTRNNWPNIQILIILCHISQFIISLGSSGISKVHVFTRTRLPVHRLRQYPVCNPLLCNAPAEHTADSAFCCRSSDFTAVDRHSKHSRRHNWPVVLRQAV